MAHRPANSGGPEVETDVRVETHKDRSLFADALFCVSRNKLTLCTAIANPATLKISLMGNAQHSTEASATIDGPLIQEVGIVTTSTQLVASSTACTSPFLALQPCRDQRQEIAGSFTGRCRQMQICAR